MVELPQHNNFKCDGSEFGDVPTSMNFESWCTMAKEGTHTVSGCLDFAAIQWLGEAIIASATTGMLRTSEVHFTHT